MRTIKILLVIVTIFAAILISQLSSISSIAKHNEETQNLNLILNTQQILHSALLLDKVQNSNSYLAELENIKNGIVVSTESEINLKNALDQYISEYRKTGIKRNSYSAYKKLQAEITYLLEEHKVRLSDLAKSDSVAPGNLKLKTNSIVEIANLSIINGRYANELLQSLKVDPIKNAYSIRLIEELFKIETSVKKKEMLLNSSYTYVYVNEEYIAAYSEVVKSVSRIQKEALNQNSFYLGMKVIGLIVVVIFLLVILLIYFTSHEQKRRYLKVTAESKNVINENLRLIEWLRKGGDNKEINISGTTSEIYKEINTLKTINEQFKESVIPEQNNSRKFEVLVKSLIQLKESLEEILTKIESKNNAQKIKSIGEVELLNETSSHLQQLSVTELELLQEFHSSLGGINNSINNLKQSISTIHIQLGANEKPEINSSLNGISETIRSVNDSYEKLSSIKSEMHSVFDSMNDKIESITVIDDKLQSTLSDDNKRITDIDNHRSSLVKTTINKLEQMINEVAV
jgi:hypothetical protein